MIWRAWTCHLGRAVAARCRAVPRAVAASSGLSQAGLGPTERLRTPCRGSATTPPRAVLSRARGVRLATAVSRAGALDRVGRVAAGRTIRTLHSPARDPPQPFMRRTMRPAGEDAPLAGHAHLSPPEPERACLGFGRRPRVAYAGLGPRPAARAMSYAHGIEENHIERMQYANSASPGPGRPGTRHAGHRSVPAQVLRDARQSGVPHQLLTGGVGCIQVPPFGAWPGGGAAAWRGPAIQGSGECAGH